MERTRIAEQHACVTDRVVMHVFSYPECVTASELEHLASQWGYQPSPGIAAKSEPFRYKGVEAMHVFALREWAGAQCLSFPPIYSERDPLTAPKDLRSVQKRHWFHIPR
jgi:hypothetical protein